MKTEYSIESVAGQFTVVDPCGEQVSTYPSEGAAKQDIGRCQRQDAMYETAKQMLDIVIVAHMRMFGVDRETAWRWVFSAMGECFTI